MVALSDVAQLVIDLSKATFDNVYLSASTLQGMVEDRVSAFAHGVCPASSPLPGLVDECTGLLRRTRADLKDTIDRCVVLVSAPLRRERVSAAPAPPAARRRGRPPRPATHAEPAVLH